MGKVYAIRVTPTTSAIVQNVLFSMGILWKVRKTCTIKELDAPYLVIVERAKGGYELRWNTHRRDCYEMIELDDILGEIK